MTLFDSRQFRNLQQRLGDWLKTRAIQVSLGPGWATRHRKGTPHGLPGQLIVSLTSYPARFGTLALTLKTLLSQTAAPDRTILWVAKKDRAALPRDVLALCELGLEIHSAEDTGSYTKLVPALTEFPDAFVITADDDIYYPPDWLGPLTKAYDRASPKVVCHRAHKLKLDEAGAPRPYREWFSAAKDPETSPLLLATGCGGVLYFPGCLHPDATNSQLYLELAPRVDDIWFYWMARRAGTLVTTTALIDKQLCWRGSQRAAMWPENVRLDGPNDRAVRNLYAAFGLPGVLRDASHP